MKKIPFFILLTSTSLFSDWVINSTYTAFWDTDLNATTLVSYELEYSDATCAVPVQKRPRFYQEKNQGYKSSQYRFSGYDRGHLAPHRSFACSKEDIGVLYNMVNVVPMKPRTNRYIWYKFERLERFMATIYRQVFIVNTIYYNDQKIINGMRIPTSFKKCIHYQENQKICLEASNKE